MKENKREQAHEQEHEQEQEHETPAYSSNMSGDDIMGRSDLYVDPLAALFTQNMVVAPAVMTGIPPFSPFNTRAEDGEKEEEDELRK